MIATWKGYRSERFVLEGRDCILVQPDIPMRSSPWIWRTEFFGAFPALDLALLEAGFRVAYIDVQNMYGAPIAMRYMDQFYARMVETFGLLPTCVLEGFSRGALYALNWAALNPRSVACLYLDAPVCDFKSWPAGRGRAQGSADDWQSLKQAYGFTEEQALADAMRKPEGFTRLCAQIPLLEQWTRESEVMSKVFGAGRFENRWTSFGARVRDRWLKRRFRLRRSLAQGRILRRGQPLAFGAHVPAIAFGRVIDAIVPVAAFGRRALRPGQTSLSGASHSVRRNDERDACESADQNCR